MPRVQKGAWHNTEPGGVWDWSRERQRGGERLSCECHLLEVQSARGMGGFYSDRDGRHKSEMNHAAMGWYPLLPCGCSGCPYTTPCARSPARPLRCQQGHPAEKRQKANLTTTARPTVPKNLKPGVYDASAATPGAFAQNRFFTMPARPKTPKPNTALLNCLTRRERTTRAWLFGQNLRPERGHLASFVAMPIWPKVRSEKSRQHLSPRFFVSGRCHWSDPAHVIASRAQFR